MSRSRIATVVILGAASCEADVRIDDDDVDDPDAVPFEEATLIVETNATDGDAGLQVFLDHEPWKAIAIFGPDGRRLLDVDTRGDLGDFGLTELFSESNEPPFTEFPIDEFKQLFPEGDYTFVGRTVEGDTIRSQVPFTHAFPAGPAIRSPSEGSAVARDEFVVRWAAVTEPAGIVIEAYQVIVEREDPLRVFSVDLPADATELAVPSQFLESGVEYKVEVAAIEEGGNRTLTELAFEIE